MSISRNITVFIADDSIVLRERLLEMLGDIPGVEILGCAEEGLHAITSIRALKPDAVVLDIQMPRGTGLDVLKNIKWEHSGPTVVVFTNFPYPQYRKRALEFGADFFFDKTTEFEKLRDLFVQLTGNFEPQETH
ncbi:MAG TPA: response regulator transcription factor [Candidatus Limnocylindria bacterium]|nr:response regulator transcription factor [Candidatus Limnocylindria bacterium]